MTVARSLSGRIFVSNEIEADPPAPQPSDTWLTVEEAVQAAKVSKRALYSWMADRKVQWKVTAGGRRRILASSLWRS